MSYCVKCGHELIEKENGIDGMVPYCPNCQEFRFPMFNSAVSALVLNPKKDKILLIQQYGHKDNILIAGYVTKGENAKQALFREVKEETGLTIKNPYLCGLYHWYKHSIHNIILVYKASEYEGVLHSSDEGEVYWIDKEDFLKQPLATGMEYVWDIVHKQHQECIMSNMGEHKRGDLF